MRHLFLVLLVALASLLGSLAASGSTGGGGDTGVWILPSCRPVTSQPGMVALRTPRASLTLAPTLTSSVGMATSCMGVPGCALWGMPAAVPLPMTVSGSVVTLPVQTLQLVRDTGIRAEGLIVDGTGNGYLVHVLKTVDGKIQVQIY